MAGGGIRVFISGKIVLERNRKIKEINDEKKETSPLPH